MVKEVCATEKSLLKMNKLQKSKDKTENSNENILAKPEQNPGHIPQSGPATRSSWSRKSEIYRGSLCWGEEKKSVKRSTLIAKSILQIERQKTLLLPLEQHIRTPSQKQFRIQSKAPLDVTALQLGFGTRWSRLEFGGRGGADIWVRLTAIYIF